MVNIKWFVVSSMVIGSLVFSLLGCGQQTSTTTTTTTLPVSAGIAISGNLYSGVVRTSSARASAAGARIMGAAVSPIQNYSVVAVGTIDNKVYFSDAKTDASGNFTISNLPSGESFYLEIIDNKKKFVAPVSFGATTEGLVMAVTPEAGGGTINLGQLVYESGKGAAVPTLEVGSAMLDKDSTAKQKSGETFVPVGAGVLGRGTGEAKFTGTLKDKVDEDNDGLPDVVDIDDNGDGKVDGLDPTPRLSGRVEVKVAGVNNSNAFSNLPQQYENYPTYISGTVNNAPIDVATQTNLAIEVVMSPGTDPSTFSNVSIVEGPAWIDTATIASDSPSSLVGTLWKNAAYALYKSTDRWTVHVTPNGTPEAGDVLKFRVTSSSGSQEFIATLTYVFNDIPRLVAYSDTAGTKEGAALNLAVYQNNSNKFNYTGSTLNLIWTAPKDDTGAYISGMQYYLDGINYYNSGGTVVIQAGSLQVSPTAVSDPTFGTVNLVTFTPTTETGWEYFKVDVKAQSPTSGGGNASQMINFKKI